ncbi:MAG: hypothetical protein K2Q18_08590 [Bdellovibrionales bacterium]|nr:hypothetical protein [Bdellovibrionales bacterium]
MSEKEVTSLTILDQFTPQVLGIFWITPEHLSRDLQGFDSFNYLFDGLISQYLYGQEDHPEKHAHIFFTENFQERIFLAHLKAHDLTKSQLAGDIDEQVALLQNKKTDQKIVLVLDKTTHEWTNELKKRYPQFDFKTLNL